MGANPVSAQGGLNSFWLEPSHIATVITTQRLCLPDDVTGLATLVTSLTQKGILCLNVGIIDPCYEGQLSAILLNFSDKPRQIQLNDRLFRVIFFKHNKITGDSLERFEYPKYEYQKDLRQRAKFEFSETFLDVKGLHKLVTVSAWKIVWQSVLTNWLPWIALIVGLLGVIFGGIALFKES